MKRTMLGAIIAIMSVGIGPAMLAGPSAVLADEADDEESEEEAHDPENSGGGGGGGSPVDDLLNLPALDSVRDEIDQRIRMDLPALNLVGPSAPSGDAIRQQVEKKVSDHIHRQNCCGQDARDYLPDSHLLRPEVEQPQVSIQVTELKDEVIVPKIDIVEDLGKTIELDVEQRLQSVR